MAADTLIKGLWVKETGESKLTFQGSGAAKTVLSVWLACQQRHRGSVKPCDVAHEKNGDE